MAGGGLTAPDLVSPEWRGLFPLGLAYGAVIGAGLSLAVGVGWLVLDHRVRVPGRAAPLVSAGLTVVVAVAVACGLLGLEALTAGSVWILVAYTAAVAAGTTRYITTRREAVGPDPD